MKIKKTISDKVVSANRANAKKSTGAKTVIGKQNSRRNAQTHGLFAQELQIAQGEEKEFKTVKKDILAQLLPETVLQRIAVDSIICFIWKIKLAARIENAQLNPNSGHDVETKFAHDETAAGWYCANRGNLQAAIRFLAQLREDVAHNGRVREFFKDDLVAHFGSYFYDQLAEWLPVNIDLLGFTTQMYNHSKTYNLPLPDKIQTAVPDIRARLEMVLKLIDQQTCHLQDLEKSYAQRNAMARHGASDSSSRHFSSATRDLHNAVNWFSDLKRQRL